MKLKFWSTILLVTVMLSLIGGCIFLPQKDGYVKILVYSGEPNNPSAVVSAMDTLFVGIDGLQAYERYEIEIQNSDGSTMAKYALNATGEGKLPPTAMWPDAGLPPALPDGPADPRANIQVGSYKVKLTGPNTDVTFPFSVITKNSPYIWSCNVSGSIKNGYSYDSTTDVGEIIYVAGMNFEAKSDVDVYIMRDKDIWSDNDFLNDSSIYVKKCTVSTDPEGNLLPIDLNGYTAEIPVSPSGDPCYNFDIIVDANQNGILDSKDAVDGRNAAGYTVQLAPSDPIIANMSVKAMQLASNGRALDYTTHWDDLFYYPDIFKQDGSDTGFAWEGFGRGVFCILNPIIDYTGINGLVPWSMVQVWVIRQSDFANLLSKPANERLLTGLDVSDSLGRPDLVWVQQTCSNGAGSILVWQAPLQERRPSQPQVVPGEGFVLIVEKPDENGNFDNIFDKDNDYVDGDLTVPETDYRGFSVDIPNN